MQIWSHALHGRVSWNECVYHYKTIQLVTPFTGVWVEIDNYREKKGAANVTPFTGVWVEIDVDIIFTNKKNGSRPSRACELKCVFEFKSWAVNRSRPSRACELKLNWMILKTLLYKSRPSRACELKCLTGYYFDDKVMSRPSRACELKWVNAVLISLIIRHALHGRVSWNFFFSPRLD